MATLSTKQGYIDVTILEPNVEARSLTLPEGATLADLLREAGAVVRSPSLLINGRPVEDVITLESGMTVTINAEDVSGSPNGSWRSTVGMFRHPDFWREVIAEGQAIREADREMARDEAEQDDR